MTTLAEVLTLHDVPITKLIAVRHADTDERQCELIAEVAVLIHARVSRELTDILKEAVTHPSLQGQDREHAWLNYVELTAIAEAAEVLPRGHLDYRLANDCGADPREIARQDAAAALNVLATGGAR